MRQKVRSKNLKYSFIRFDKEKNMEVFLEAGWHFNNIMEAQKISQKLKTYAHSEYSDEKFSSIEVSIFALFSMHVGKFSQRRFPPEPKYGMNP